MIRRFLLPVLVFTASLLPAAPAVPLVNLVDDQTLFAVSVTDAPGLLRGWDNSPFATTWNDPQVAKFLAPLRTEMKVDDWDAETKAATGMTLRELLALAKGEALIAVPSVTAEQFEKSDAPPFLLALEIGEEGEKVQALIAKSVAEKSLKEETETFSGVKVTTTTLPETGKTDADAELTEEPAKPSTVSWAIADGVWLISAEKTRVLSAIDALKQGGAATALGKSERFLRTRERAGSAQALAFVNIPAIYPLVRDAIAATKAEGEGGMGALGVDPEAVFNAFALDALGEAFLALRTEEKESRIDAGLFYTEERGLMKLLAYQPGAAPRPDWIPAKWPSVSTARFSIPKAYAGLKETLMAISPMFAGMAEGQIRAVNKQLRIDIERDLIGSFGDELVSAYAVPPGVEPGKVPAWTEMDQLISVSLANEASFAKAIEAIKQLAGPAAEQMFTRREYLGTSVFTLNLPPPAPGMKAPRGFSYAIAKGTFLLGIGSVTTVDNALQGMNSPEGQFWKRDDVKVALAEVPADAVSLQVQDLRLMIASVVEAVVQFQEEQNKQAQGEEGEAGEKKTFVDVEARPDSDVIARHWGMAGGYATRTSEGLFSTTILAHPQK